MNKFNFFLNGCSPIDEAKMVFISIYDREPDSALFGEYDTTGLIGAMSDQSVNLRDTKEKVVTIEKTVTAYPLFLKFETNYEVYNFKDEDIKTGNGTIKNFKKRTEKVYTATFEATKPKAANLDCFIEIPKETFSGQRFGVFDAGQNSSSYKIKWTFNNASPIIDINARIFCNDTWSYPWDPVRARTLGCESNDETEDPKNPKGSKKMLK